MNPFFAYLIKSSVSLALLYILFRLAMRNDKTHSLNRFLLLAILLLATVIPFLDFQFFYEEVPLKQVEVFREFVSTPILTNDVTMPEVQSVQKASSFSINPFLALYIIAILVLLIRLFISVIRVLQIIQNAEKRKLSNIVLAIVKDLIQPFTFFNKIILSEKDFNENKDIVVAHEHAHIKQMHAIDLVVCELFTVVHFFNPFMWLLRRDLKLVHEYQADQAVLNKGIDAKKYQLLVLEKSVGERRFAMANHFTQKPILKRIKMMKKKNKNQWTWMKLILFVPIVLVLLQAFAQPEQKLSESGTFTEVGQFEDTIKPAPPRVLEVLPQNPQYDKMPTIRFYETWINLNNKSCELTNLKNALENLFPNDGTQRKVELIVYSTTSKERVEQIYAELQNMDDLEIIRKDVTPPPPPPLKPITLKRNGSIGFGGKVYSFEEFEQRIMAIEIQHRMVSNKNDDERYRMRAKVVVESGTDEASIIRLKKIMGKVNFYDVSYNSM